MGIGVAVDPWRVMWERVLLSIPRGSCGNGHVGMGVVVDPWWVMWEWVLLSIATLCDTGSDYLIETTFFA